MEILVSSGCSLVLPRLAFGIISVLPLLPGGVAQAAPKLLPQFAFGGGWYSALYFTNTSDSPVAFQVDFTGDDGNPLNVPSVAGSSTTVSLAPHGTAIIEAPNFGPLKQGYAPLSLPSGVVTYGVFRQSLPGLSDQEAVVPLSGAFSTASTLIWDESNFSTGVAIVNPSSVPTTVAIVLRDTGGVIIGSTTVPLAAKNPSIRLSACAITVSTSEGVRDCWEIESIFARQECGVPESPTPVPDHCDAPARMLARRMKPDVKRRRGRRAPLERVPEERQPCWGCPMPCTGSLSFRSRRSQPRGTACPA